MNSVRIKILFSILIDVNLLNQIQKRLILLLMNKVILRFKGKFGLVGLQNLGNTCYMNSAL